MNIKLGEVFMRIDSANGLPFRATLRGDYEKIVKISTEGGLPEDIAKKALKTINKLFPSDNDKVYFYFRKYENENKKLPAAVRSGIKISTKDKVLELNVDPNEPPQRQFLFKMLSSLKRLAKGKVAPDNNPHLYEPVKGSWVDNYKDTETVARAVTPMF